MDETTERCTICKENPATQSHHVSIEPEIVIAVCAQCHNDIHSHGTGIPGLTTPPKSGRVERHAHPGRPRKTEIHSGVFSFSLRDQNGIQTLEAFDEIAARERLPRSRLLVKAMHEYIEKHGPGNYQTILSSYEEGGHKSQAQAEAEILAKLKEYHEVSHALIRNLVKDRLGLEGQELVQVLSRISKAWRSQGGTVWV